MRYRPPMTDDHGDLFGGLMSSWEIALQAANKSQRTIDSYRSGVATLAAWLRARDLDDDIDLPRAVLRAEIRACLADELTRLAPNTVRNRYMGMLQFFRWLTQEGEIDESPMNGIPAPAVPATPVQHLDEDQLRALLATCKGADFTSRRDNAVLRLFIDTGIRRAEMAGLKVEDVELRERLAYVIGKGSRPRAVPFGARTALALDRYIRARAKHRHAASPVLWLGDKGKGPLTVTGIEQLVSRRGERIGIRLHPHMLRHTMAHHWLANEGSEGDLMRIGGWRTRQMLDRYGASGADARAREAHKVRGLGDRL